MPEIEPFSSRPVSRRAFFEHTTALALASLATARAAKAAPQQDPAPAQPPLRVRIWCEGTAPRNIYPDDIDGAVSQALQGQADIQFSTARLDQPDAGLPDAILQQTDVLVWWGRLKHENVPNDRSDAIVKAVRAGTLGLIALHGSYASKPFQALMGKPCEPKSWRDEGQPERIAIQTPDHPIARGVEPFTIPRTQMFAEPFEVPTPETVVLLSTWETGESFRSGLTWTVEKGRVAYLRPGDESFPVLFHPSIKQVLLNSVRWAGKRI